MNPKSFHKMSYIEQLDNLLDRCISIKPTNDLCTKLQLIELTYGIHEAAQTFTDQFQQVVARPTMDLLSRENYDDCRQRIDDCISSFTLPAFHDSNSKEFCGQMVDWFVPDRNDGTSLERAEKMGYIVTTLMSKEFSQAEEWTGIMKKALHELDESIEKVADLADKQWTKSQYELLMEDLETKYGSVNCANGKNATKAYNKWKRRTIGEHDEYPDLLSALVKELLTSGAIIVDESHSGLSYRNKKSELSHYIAIEDITDDLLKSFATLCKISGHKDGRFQFKSHTLGKYFFQYRGSLSADTLKSFFRFKRMCQLAYADMDKANATAEEQSPNKTDPAKEESGSRRQFTSEEVQKSGIVKYADMVLDLLDKKKTLEPRIYWYCIYHVLCEKGWVKKNITAFCAGMKDLFGVQLDRSAMNAEKKTYENLRVEDWCEAEERLKRKKAFGLQFKAELEACLDRKLKAALNG